jgi:hypothetical protein
LLAHGWWFSQGTPASSTTETGRWNIAESGANEVKVAFNTKWNIMLLYIRDRPFNLQGWGVMVFCFVQIFFSDNTRDRIFFFFLSREAGFFFQNGRSLMYNNIIFHLVLNATLTSFGT